MLTKYRITRIWDNVIAEDYVKALEIATIGVHDEVNLLRTLDDHRVKTTFRTFCNKCEKEIVRDA